MAGQFGRVRPISFRHIEALGPQRRLGRALRLVRHFADAARPPAKPCARRQSALVVGTDVGQNRFCEILLQALGLRVDIATSAAQALLALERGSFGLVIVDASALDLDRAFWSRLPGLLGQGAARGAHLYVVTDRDGVRPCASGGYRTLPRPVRALSLVEAAERLR
jgi:hypothetical protein